MDCAAISNPPHLGPLAHERGATAKERANPGRESSDFQGVATPSPAPRARLHKPASDDARRRHAEPISVAKRKAASGAKSLVCPTFCVAGKRQFITTISSCNITLDNKKPAAGR